MPTHPNHPCHFSRRELLHLLGGLVAGVSLDGVASPLEAQSRSGVTGLPTEKAWTDVRSDLGSLYPFIQAQADRSPLSLSYLHGDFPDLTRWQAKARSSITELLHYQPPRVPPGPQVVDTQETEHLTRHRLSFMTSPDCRVPAYLLVPRRVEGPAPGVVVLHDQDGVSVVAQALQDVHQP